MNIAKSAAVMIIAVALNTATPGITNAGTHEQDQKIKFSIRSLVDSSSEKAINNVKLVGKVIQGNTLFSLVKQPKGFYCSPAGEDQSTVNPNATLEIEIAVENYRTRKIQFILIAKKTPLKFHLTRTESKSKKLYEEGKAWLGPKKNTDAALATFEHIWDLEKEKRLSGFQIAVLYNYARALKDACVHLNYSTCKSARLQFQILLRHARRQPEFLEVGRVHKKQINAGLNEIKAHKIKKAETQTLKGDLHGGRQALARLVSDSYLARFKLARSYVDECQEKRTHCETLLEMLPGLHAADEPTLNRLHINRQQIHGFEVIALNSIFLQKLVSKNFPSAVETIEQMIKRYKESPRWAKAARKVGVTSKSLAKDRVYLNALAK